ncbi:glycosyltransferase family 39 protein [bacterium]|nr:glycosyltransferase family 39 protein [bacterium]
MNKKALFFLIIVLIIASFFRLWELNKIPPGLYPDEAINGNDAFKTLKTKSPHIFYPENNGREGLFINIVALAFSFLGISSWSIRIVSAIAGIITVAGFYFLIKELSFYSKKFKQSWEYLALLSSFLLATSFWHTNFSRIGFRGILVPLVLVFSFYFLIKGFKEQKQKFLMIAGIIFGIGFYTYIAFRLAVILIAIILFLEFLQYKEKKQLKNFFLLSSLYLFFIFIVALPIGIYFMNHPDYFISRATGVSIFSQKNYIKAFGESLIKHLAMFNIQGDGNWRHNIPNTPELFWPVGITFLIGIGYSIFQNIKAIKDKNWQEFFLYCFLLSWWFIMLLPGILTYEGIPHALRCIGAIPPVFAFAAIGIFIIAEKLNFYLREKVPHLILFVAIIVIGLIFTLVQYNRYFIVWGKNKEVRGAFCQRFVEIGNYLNSFSDNTSLYVIVNEGGVAVPYPNGIPMPAQTLMFVENEKFGHQRAVYLKTEDVKKINPDNQKTVIVIMKYDEALINNLKEKFPRGEIHLEPQKGIWSYLINF